MCYKLALSTNAPFDLATLNSETAFFVQDLDEIDEKQVNYEHKYRVATHADDNCSCYFRILENNDAKKYTFEQLLDWREEDPNDIDIINNNWLL